MDTEPRFIANGFAATSIDFPLPSPSQPAPVHLAGAHVSGESLAGHPAPPIPETPQPGIGEARQRLFRFVMANVGRDDPTVLAAIAGAAPSTRALLADPARLSSHLQSLADELRFLQPVQLNRLKSLARQATAPAPATAHTLANPDLDETAPSHRNAAPPSDSRHSRSGFTRQLAPADIPAGDASDPAKLLESITYQVQRNGTVQYALNGKPIFTDHGENILMVKGAEEQEQAILAALLIAKEKFAGTFDITGDAAFKRRTIEIILKYRLAVRLKDPEQDAMRRALAGEAFPQPAKSGESVRAANANAPRADFDGQVPSPVRQKHTDETAQFGGSAVALAQRLSSERQVSPTQTPTTELSPAPARAPAPPEKIQPVDRLAGRILSFGAAPYDDKPGNKISFFVLLENADGHTHKVWGIDLERALKSAGAAAGDHIALENLGRQPVSVPQDTLDAAGNVVAREMVDTYRNTWRAEVSRRMDADSPRDFPRTATDSQAPHSGAQPPQIPRILRPAKPDADAAHGREWFEVRAAGAATSYHATPREAMAAAEQRHIDRIFIVNTDFQESVLRNQNGTWLREPPNPAYGHDMASPPPPPSSPAPARKQPASAPPEAHGPSATAVQSPTTSPRPARKSRAARSRA